LSPPARALRGRNAALSRRRLHRAILAGSRHPIVGSTDGQNFHEILLFTADQGARLLCRFLRVERDAAGPAPVIAFGSEGTFEPTSVATSEISIADDGEIETEPFSLSQRDP
jgi:hypothetical protein